MLQIKNSLVNLARIRKACYYQDKNGQLIGLEQSTEGVYLFYSSDTKRIMQCVTEAEQNKLCITRGITLG